MTGSCFISFFLMQHGGSRNLHFMEEEKKQIHQSGFTSKLLGIVAFNCHKFFSVCFKSMDF